METQFKKVTIKEATPPKDKKGWKLQGQFVELKKKPYQRFDKTKGELTEQNFVQLILEEKGEKIAYPCDSGLLEQITLNSIKPGTLIMAVNNGLKDIGQGRKMNDWDLFTA